MSTDDEETVRPAHIAHATAARQNHGGREPNGVPDPPAAIGFPWSLGEGPRQVKGGERGGRMDNAENKDRMNEPFFNETLPRARKILPLSKFFPKENSSSTPGLIRSLAVRVRRGGLLPFSLL